MGELVRVGEEAVDTRGQTQAMAWAPSGKVGLVSQISCSFQKNLKFIILWEILGYFNLGQRNTTF